MNNNQQKKHEAKLFNEERAARLIEEAKPKKPIIRRSRAASIAAIMAMGTGLSNNN